MLFGLGPGVRCRGTSARCGISGSDHECTSHHSDWRSHYTHRSERLPLAHDPTFDAPGEYKLPHVTLKKGWLSWTAGTDGFACAHGNGAPSNRKSASDHRRPQPHSQVMDNGIATSSLAIDLLWEARVYRGCLRWLRFASVEKRSPHRSNGQRLAKVLPIRRSSGGSPQATNLLCERSSHGIGWRCIGGCCAS